MMDNSPDSFTTFNEEIDQFHKQLQENYTPEEIRRILSPILRRNNRTAPKRLVLIFMIPMLIMGLFYMLTYSETLYWHLSAIGRIFLIRLLPLWDWPKLKNEQCLIGNFLRDSPRPMETSRNCDLCENISHLDVHEEISSELLQERYLDVDLPVIIRKTTDRRHNLTNLIAAMSLNEELSASVPCKVGSSVYDGSATVGKLLKRAGIFDRFFLHFQNCQLAAVKQFRRTVCGRPDFLSRTLSPVQYNWLLWNRNYSTANYKALQMAERFGALVMLGGSLAVRLVPHHSCDLYCPTVEVKLEAGETLMFGKLWEFEYRSEGGDNMAVLLEMY